MRARIYTSLVRVVAIILVLSLAVPASAATSGTEEVMPLASYYLNSYNTYICAMGNGKLQIWFTVAGVNYMDEIGTLSIFLYESSDKTVWTRVKTFLHEDYAAMLAEDDIFHSSYVAYKGTAGKYYKAYVCIWAGKDGSGDTRYMWTPVELAT